MTLAGDPTNPIRYEVKLAFGQSEDVLPAELPGPLANGKGAGRSA
jgi:hypothetical protein